ncbi:MAG: bifunctional homocysteine S-methyltransferase/methylenetetrahydrofolate reductase [Actinobacteria bacterium]|nr:bifunctional homocysteine S-methyltransferase/methylenetetrahydrofolate reductase [Actinomycetota bacterium]
MDRAGLREVVSAGTLLGDGGMGTSLIANGAPLDACFEAFNVHDPARVEQVHRGFVEAGARLVLTNTFGGNRFRLDRHGVADRVHAFNRAAPTLARRAGAELVGGSVGPLGVRLSPYGRVRAEEAFEAYREQIEALLDGGIDLIEIETQTDLREMEQALAAAREAAPEIAVIVTATFTRDDRTLLGSPPEEVARRLAELGADAIGVNCGEGPAQVLRVLRAMRPWAAGVPLVARPNAGGPREVAGRFVYPATPDYFAEHVRAFVREGAAVVGGCCGTGPAHTRAMAAALVGAPAAARAEESVTVTAELAETPVAPGAPPTELQARISGGGFVVAVEMEPPRSYSTATLVAAAETLAQAGADVIDVADSPMAKMRMSAWAACRLIQERVGIEAVLHFPTRGRNLLRLQGDLLGAYALGIRNLFVCVGDPVTIGDFPQGSNNVDVTATGLLALITEEFNRGRDQGGASIGEPTSFFVGAAVAPAAEDLERECRLLKRKADAGAGFALSQPVYDPALLGRLRETYERVAGKPLTIPVLAGVLPLATARHAEFLHNEVPGIVIPASIRDRLAAAGEDAAREGVAMAVELVGSLRAAGAAGVYVMPQFGRYDLAAEVVEAARRG